MRVTTRPLNLHVLNTGTNQGDGSLTNPWPLLDRAQAGVRDLLKQLKPPTNVVVHIAAGSYYTTPQK